MSGVNPFYWSLWAAARRAEYASGYYSEQSWYMPPMAGDTFKEAEDDFEPPATVEDYLVVEDIDQILSRLKPTRPEWIRALEIVEGAYADASPDKNERFRQWGVCKRTTQKWANRARAYVEREMYRC